MESLAPPSVTSHISSHFEMTVQPNRADTTLTTHPVPLDKPRRLRLATLVKVNSRAKLTKSFSNTMQRSGFQILKK